MAHASERFLTAAVTGGIRSNRGRSREAIAYGLTCKSSPPDSTHDVGVSRQSSSSIATYREISRTDDTDNCSELWIQTRTTRLPVC